jgi:predicted ABC-type ATPase
VRSMENLMKLYIPLADRWSIVDNSSIEPVMVAEKLARSSEVHVYSKSIWARFEEMK